MAEIDTTAAPDLIESDDETVTIGKNRHLVALEATWEIEQLCKALRTFANSQADVETLVVRGLSARITELGEIIMAALEDKSADTNSLAYRLRLKREDATA